MMNSDIPVKTSKGLADLGKRGGSLPQLMRSPLLLVNGRMTVEGYVASLRNFGDVAQMFDALEQEGLMACRKHNVSAGARPSATSSSESSPTASTPIPKSAASKPSVQITPQTLVTKRPSDADISLIRGALLDLFSAKLGYHALDLMLRLESATSAESLLTTRELARSLFASHGADWKPAERPYERLNS